jgi:hypothetical protein
MKYLGVAELQFIRSVPCPQIAFQMPPKQNQAQRIRDLEEKLAA